MAPRLRIHNLTGVLLLALAVLSPTIAAAAATITVSPTAVDAGALITTTVAGGPGTAGDWVALAAVNAVDSSYVEWKYLNGSTTAPTTGLTGATVTFTAPATPGSVYQVRWFSNNSYTRVATSATITVTGGGAPPTVTVSPTTAAPGATLTTTVANGPGAVGDWVALNPVSGPDQSYVQWKYLNGSTTAPPVGLTGATVTFTAPTTPGSYQVRWFSNNTYTRLATSATITVTGGSAPSVTVSPTSVAPGATVTATVADGAGAVGDWVALNPVSGPDQSYVEWKYLNGLTTTPATGLTGATVTFTAPATAGSYHVRWFSNNTYIRVATSATITVTGADTVAPTVSVTAPATGAAVSGSAVSVTATAADNVGVVGVQFKVDGANLGAEDTASSYTQTWNTTAFANGTHTLTAVARDAAGNITTSAAVTVTVNNSDTTAPAVTVTAPAAGAMVAGAIAVSATASDNVGVVGVQFKLDGINLGAEDTASAYTQTWNTTTTANGLHTLTAVARDAAGNTTTSSAVTVTVSNADTTAPTIAMTAPAAGATVSGAAVTISATATDNVGVVGVQFKLDGANLGAEDTAGPYSLSWNTTTIANGTHTLTAVARDAAGNTASAAARTVTVSNASAARTIWNASATPDRIEISDNNSAEVGVRFQSESGGVITGVRFYKGTTNTGTHTGSLWTNGGALLATGTFASETASGWQELTFGAPVAITANTTYVASYHTNVGQYAVSDGFFATAVHNPPLHALSDGYDGANGVFSYGATAFPTQTFQAANYWVDVVFVASGVGDTAPPTVSITTPSSGVTVSGSAVLVSATATDNVGVVGVQFRVDGVDVAGEDPASPYTLSWDTTLFGDGTRVLTAVARDAAGNTTIAAGVTVTVNNAGGDTTPPTVSITAPSSGATVSGSAVPVSATATDTVGVVGVQFKVDGVNLGAEDTASPYTLSWNTTLFGNGTRVLTAVARDAAGNTATAAAVTVTVNNAGADTTPPAVSITAPSSGATVSGTAVLVSATATDTVGVVGVQFKVDGVNLGAEDTASPYTLSWNTTLSGNGTRVLTAVARDAAGNTATAAAVTVTVNNAGGDTTPPTVSITAPTSGATVSGTAVLVSATATDNVGVVGVQFRVDGVDVAGEDTVSPYTLSWNTTLFGNGTRVLTVVARDAAGNVTTSAAATVTVNNAAGDTAPPTVSITAPSSGATVSGSAVVVSATATDNVGVVGVQLKVDGVNLGAEDTASPYSLTWNTTTTANGSHTLTAVARDAAGNTATSAGVTVTVSNSAALPTTVVFTASTDHAQVTSYLLDVFANGANPNTATPVASSDLGKPTPAANSDISVDRTTFVNGLAPGTYIATVSALGGGGPGRSTSVTFTR